MNQEESFADQPISIAEARANRSFNAQDWKPRDALIAVLRDIDGGKTDPTGLIVCWNEEATDEQGKSHLRSRFYCSAPNPLLVLGLLHRIAHKFQGE